MRYVKSVNAGGTRQGAVGMLVYMGRLVKWQMKTIVSPQTCVC